MKIAILDDNRQEQEKLTDQINAWAGKNSIAVSARIFDSGEEFSQSLNREQFDIVFMDIIMDGQNGIETALRLRSISINILLIFITSSMEFMAQAFPCHAFDYIIIDEAHERSLNIDFLLGYLKNLLKRRKNLKVIITDILVFMDGERSIYDFADFLGKKNLKHTEVLPLYARLSNAEQNRIFQPHSGRHIILATNVAETSLTVPGIKYVIDFGDARISRYSARTGVQRLPIEPVSKASADQRKGRCGRTCPGICIRLYSEEDFNQRPDYTDPEILRTNLASVILQMITLRLGDIEDFPFIDAPDHRQITDGYRLLDEIGALEDHRLTADGKLIARLPVDPRLAKMAVAACRTGALSEILIIISAL